MFESLKAYQTNRSELAMQASPLQVSQFEADNRIVEQLKELYVENGGGGNNTESYNLPWYFAANHTSTDAHEKRNKKGYLFTIGDERAPNKLSRSDIQRVCGDEAIEGISNEALLESVQRMYNVFHIIIEQGDHCLHYGVDVVKKSWTPLLGQRVLPLSDYTKLAELIVSTIQIIEGDDVAAVAASWGGATASVIESATRSLAVKDPGALAKATAKGAVVRF